MSISHFLTHQKSWHASPAYANAAMPVTVVSILYQCITAFSLFGIPISYFHLLEIETWSFDRKPFFCIGCLNRKVWIDSTVALPTRCYGSWRLPASNVIAHQIHTVEYSRLFIVINLWLHYANWSTTKPNIIRLTCWRRACWHRCLLTSRASWSATDTATGSDVHVRRTERWVHAHFIDATDGTANVERLNCCA